MRIGNDVNYNGHSCLYRQQCESWGKLFYPCFAPVSSLSITLSYMLRLPEKSCLEVKMQDIEYVIVN